MNTKEIYLVYECDDCHSYNTFDLIVATKFLNKCLKIINKHVKENKYEKLSEYDIECLVNSKMTQDREYNYVVESIELT